MDKVRVKGLQSALSREYREVGELTIKLLERDGLLRGRNWLPHESPSDWLPAAERAAGYWIVLAEAYDTKHAIDIATDAFLLLCEKAPDVEPPDAMELISRPGLATASVKRLIEPEQPLSEAKLAQAVTALCDTVTELADDFRNCLNHMMEKPTESIFSPDVAEIVGEFYKMATASATAMRRCRLPAPDSHFKAAAADLLNALELFSLHMKDFVRGKYVSDCYPKSPQTGTVKPRQTPEEQRKLAREIYEKLMPKA
ncbi:MAG: hypothetical protein IKZ87_00855 [Actinomycetaceae bacterium]|nr:hypothetical protein [Actinomycetaceae bacterium]